MMLMPRRHNQLPATAFASVVSTTAIILSVILQPASAQATSNFLDFRAGVAANQDSLAVESIASAVNAKPSTDNNNVVSSDFNEFESMFENFDMFAWDRLPEEIDHLPFASLLNDHSRDVTDKDDLKGMADKDGVEARSNDHRDFIKELLSNGVDNVENELSDLLFNSTLDYEDAVNAGIEDYYYYEDDYDTTMQDPSQDVEEQAEPRMDNIELESLPLPEKYRQRRPFMQRPRPYRRRRRLGANGSPYNFRRRGRLPNTPIPGNKGVPNFNSIRQSLAKNKFRPNPTLATRAPTKLNNVRGNQVIDSARGESVKLRPTITAGPPSKSQCDYYTEDLCLEVDAYPISEIMSQIGANRRASSDLLADVSSQSADDLIDGVSSNQENTYTLAHYYGERRQDTAQPVRDFANDGGFLCPSEIKYAKPKRGKTAQGEWKDIVNVNDYTQTLRMEKCLQPGGSCSYVSHHYKSQCSQVYNYHRLLSWNKKRGLHMDIYKVPTCCSCHIMGYSYVYPPLSTKAGKQFSLPKNNPSASVQSATAPIRVRPRPSKQIPVKSQQLIPVQPSHLPAVSSLDNFISDFNPQAELEQFMSAISDDLKDFNTFGSSSPRRQGTNGKFERKGPSVPSTQLTTQTSINPVTSFNNRKGMSPTPPKKPVRNPRRPTPTPYKPLSQTFNSASTSSSTGFSQNYQTKPPFRRHKDKVNSNNRIPLVLPPKAGNRYSSIRRGDGFSESGEPQFGGNSGIGSKMPQSTAQTPAHGGNPLNKYESIKLDTSTNSKKETEDNNKQEVVNYGYHPIIDFFNT